MDTFNCDFTTLVNKTKQLHNILQLVNNFVKECSSLSPDISTFVDKRELMIKVTKYEGPEKIWNIDLDDYGVSSQGDEALMVLKTHLTKIGEIIKDSKQICYLYQLNVIQFLDSFNVCNGNSVRFECLENQ